MDSINDFSSKKILILGFGVEGESSAQFLADLDAKVTIADQKSETEFDSSAIHILKEKKVEFSFGGFPELSSYDLIVRSPGVSPQIPELQSIPAEKITSTTRIFFDLCPAPIIGVTGTKGKGTTSSLIYEMLKADGQDAYLGGNIGIPALSFLKKLTSESIVVLELSSFQLVDLHKSPHIAVMLMVTSEHLDYHKDVYEYVEAKRNILKHQTAKDFAILNKDYPASNESDIHTDAQLYFVSRDQEMAQGSFVKDGKVFVLQNGKENEITDTKDILLPGKHNWENVCAAVMASALVGVDKKSMISVLKTFKGLEHRLEKVRTVRGVSYYDDSFSTTPETAEAAIESFDQPKILILGGSSKNSDFTQLGELIEKTESIKAIIGIGSEWSRIKSHIPNSEMQIVENCMTMDEIVMKAAELSEPGDVVLLSPACASFDMFKDYKDRGNQFKNAVSYL